MSFEITERWLMDSGGWQAMKPARSLWQAGAVLAFEFDGTRLRGQVRDGGKTLASGLVIASRTEVENLCSCAESRRTGALCSHSLALGLAWVHRGKTPVPINNPGGPAARNPVTASPAKAPVPAGPLAFQLPSSFFEGLRRDRLTLAVRVLPGVVPPAGAPEDRPFLEWLAAQRCDRIPSQLSLADPAQIDSLLPSLGGHPRVSIGTAPLTVGASPVRLPLVGEQIDASRVRLRIDRTGEWQGAAWWVRAGRPIGWGFLPNQRQLFTVQVSPLIYPFLADLASGQQKGIERPLNWLVRHVDELSEVFEMPEGAEWLRFHRRLGSPEFRLVLDGSLQRMSAALWCRYAGLEEFRVPGDPHSTDAFPVVDPVDPSVFWERHRDAELAALARIERAGFVYSTADTKLWLNDEATFLQFFAGELPRLQKSWKVEFSQRATSAVRPVERITPRWTPISSGTDWLAFDLAFEGSRGTTISQADARRWLQTGQTHRNLGNGKVAVLAAEEMSDLEEVLRDLRPQQEHGHFRIAASQAAYLANSVMPAADPIAWPKCSPISLSTYWKTILREYQQIGTQWMIERSAQHLGGILADEMGLGKTVQTLAVVSTLRLSGGPGRLPNLVVAPTSLLGNWAAEAARFAPELSVLIIRSGERAEELSQLSAHDLVITSYPLLVRDLAHHVAVTWQAVFLDEAGFIRNPDTQAAKAVRELRANARFALTGTPIENSIRDLWSIAQFSVPGYLGPREDFRERYEVPLATGDPAVVARLRRRMAPYWLRRLKQDVAKDLPDKIETIIACELTPIQRDIYAAIQREGVHKVDEARRSQTASQARLTMLTALLRLRQACGDPRLLGETFPDQAPETFSGKWAALVELLEEIRDGGHSVLIFSQFATQLRLLQDAVRSVAMDFCHLDGSTPDREAQIDAFKTNPAKRVFLISLKAGGFGLNLTKADTVIHFDPWWNPAVEAQATDRAHRIGQARPVTVYKLIATGTVEEKILALQRRKRTLMESTLDDQAPLMDGLGEEELQELVRG